MKAKNIVLLANGQFPLWDATVGYHGHCIQHNAKSCASFAEYMIPVEGIGHLA